MGEKTNLTGDKGWVTYRPEIKILDCTIRDGGLINSHKFEDEFVKAVYKTCVEAGVDYMEMGYKGSKKIFAPDQFGDWKSCDEDNIRRIVGDNPTSLKLSVMADAGKTDYKEDIPPKSESVIDMIRIATYIHQIPTAVDMIKHSHDNGYETTVNIMAVSTVSDHEIQAALEVLAKSPVGVIYLVDSFGSLYSEQIRSMSKMYLDAMEGTGKQLGIHTHNNQALAFANTIEALICGANFLDATIDGIGRGAGNCALELLIGFLHNPKFKLRPVVECLEKQFVPLKKNIEWGPLTPYIITGQLNQHPRAAMKLREGNTPNEFVKFYDQMLEVE